MPYSDDSNADYVRIFVSNMIEPSSILDVGAGAGRYYELLKHEVNPNRFDALEVWSEYVKRFRLTERYDTVYETDARDFKAFDYDLVIFGDVLEHMAAEEAQAVWQRTSEKAGWGMISVPIVHYPQGEEEGNPYEVHVQEDLNVNQIEADFGPFDDKAVFETTATFFRRFK